MQSINIDLLKLTGAKQFTAKDGTEHIAIPIAANNLHVGAKGIYMPVTIIENRDGQDKYGNDGFASLDIGKERRMAGEKGPILGNWKHLNKQPERTQSTPPPQDNVPDDEQIPF
jgi:hypothetical protein